MFRITNCVLATNINTTHTRYRNCWIKKRIDIHGNIIHIHYIWRDMNFNEITRIIIYRHFPHTHHSHEGNSIIQYFTSHFNQKQKKNLKIYWNFESFSLSLKFRNFPMKNKKFVCIIPAFLDDWISCGLFIIIIIKFLRKYPLQYKYIIFRTKFFIKIFRIQFLGKLCRKFAGYGKSSFSKMYSNDEKGICQKIVKTKLLNKY